MPKLIEVLKIEFLAQAEEPNVGFSAVGVGIDWLTNDGLQHLAKFGAFDEIVVGRQDWVPVIIMKETIAGIAATPQVVVYERRYTADGDHNPPCWENRILARKEEILRIQNWMEADAPLRGVP